MSDLDVEKIRAIQVIDKSLLNVWANSCSILLDFRKHKSPVPFEISGAIRKKTKLTWKPVKTKAGYGDLERTAEDAGYGMSLLIVTTYKKLQPIDRTAKGGGIDIICSAQTEDDENFLGSSAETVHIESKGTRNHSSVKSMLNTGIAQSKKTKGQVYVISTEFETPSAITRYRKK
jgi:hypothetical protein